MIEITSSNRTVKITNKDGLFFSLLILNNAGWIDTGNIVLATKHHNTEAAARRWAAKELSR